MLGTIFAFTIGVCWAGSGTILKLLSIKMDYLLLSFIRLWVALIGLLIFVFISGRCPVLTSISQKAFFFLALSGILGMAIGDTVYIRGLFFLDVSRVYPIAMCSFPVFSLILAGLFLDEKITLTTATGAVLVFFGIYLVTFIKISKISPSPERSAIKGTLLALLAGFMWALAAATLKKGGVRIDPYVASAIRVLAGALAFTPILLKNKRKDENYVSVLDIRSSLLIALTAVLSYGVANIAYTLAVQLIGVSKTVIIMSMSPIILLIFSIFILKERLTKRAFVGILVSMGGTYLVLYS